MKKWISVYVFSILLLLSACSKQSDLPLQQVTASTAAQSRAIETILKDHGIQCQTIQREEKQNTSTDGTLIHETYYLTDTEGQTYIMLLDPKQKAVISLFHQGQEGMENVFINDLIQEGSADDLLE